MHPPKNWNRRPLCWAGEGKCLIGIHVEGEGLDKSRELWLCTSNRLCAHRKEKSLKKLQTSSYLKAGTGDP